jgi:spermidine/putrescine transport system ATP-binding protein
VLKISEVMILLDDVSKRYGGTKAVDGMTLGIHRGEFVVIMGPSGCGKTTTLRMIAGLETPDSGKIFIDDKCVNDTKPWQRDVPLVWQNFMLFPHLNVFQNVEYGLKMRNVPKTERTERVKRILKTVGLQGFDNRSVLRLSGGQKQRVGLARALVLDPKVLLLDEPLGALDAKIARSMQQELRRLHAMIGITFVYVTHNQSEAMALADRIVVMNEGKIRQIGTPNQIFRTPNDRFVAEFVGANNLLSGQITAINPGTLKILTSQGEFAVPASGTRNLNELATFVVGADLVSLGNNAPGRENHIEGRIAAVEVTGAVVTIYVTGAKGYEFQVQMPASAYERGKHKADAAVFLSWNKEDAYLLPEAS